MRTQTTISILTAAALALTSMSAVAQGRHGQGGAKAQDRAQIERGQKDFDRDRFRDRDRVNNPAQNRDRARDQDRIHAPDNAGLGQSGIYGGELMSVQERNQYREQLRLTESDPQARTKFMAEHKEQMQQRAKVKGVDIKDPPDNGDDN